MDHNDQADAEDRDYCTDKFLDEMEELREDNTALRAEVERLQERFDAVRDAAHAEAKRVFPATVIESHIGGELHADDLCSMLAAEVERLREAVLAAYRKGHHHTINGGYQWCDQGGREVVEEIIREAGEEE